MTMKMISSTSSTSINGVILISERGPSPPPTAILIGFSPVPLNLLYVATISGLQRTRWRSRLFLPKVFVNALSKQPELVYARSAQVLDHLDDAFEARARVALDVAGLVQLVGQHVLDLLWRSEEHTSELQSRLHLVC